jgi:hypothetical protein
MPYCFLPLIECGRTEDSPSRLFIYSEAISPKRCYGMSEFKNTEFRAVFRNWAEQIERHQRQIFLETAKFVEMLKQKKVSAKTKNEILIVVKGLQATVKSISKVVTKYTE